MSSQAQPSDPARPPGPTTARPVDPARSTPVRSTHTSTAPEIPAWIRWPARAVAWLVRTLAVEPLRWTHRALLAPAAHWLRDVVVEPARLTTRGVLVALGLRR